MPNAHSADRNRVPFPCLARLILVEVLIAALAVWFLDRPSDLTSSVPWVFVVILLVGFAAASMQYLGPRCKATRALGEATKRLPNGAGSGTAEITNAQLFGGHGLLRKTWRDFREARNPPPADAPRPRPGARSAVSAADFFTIDTVLGPGQGTLPNALPGVFTAIGLLGTFVGIATGLGGIDLDAPSEERLEAIGNLMAGMSIAFLTSIVGITLSVWWLFEFRGAERALKSALGGFLARAGKVFPVEQPHETLIRIGGSVAVLEGMEKTAEGIKGSIQQLGEDLSGALENHLVTYVTEPLQNLNADLGHRQIEALERMVESFQNTLVSSVGERLTAFGDALRAASDYQVRAGAELRRFFDRLDEVSDTQTRLLQRTVEVADVFEAGLARLVEAKEAIGEAGRSARETMDAARDLARECQRQLEEQEKASGAAARSWDAQVEAMTHLRDELRDLTGRLTEKVEEFQLLSAQKISETFHLFDSEMARVTDHLGGTMDELRELATRLLRATRAMPEAVGEFRDATSELAKTGIVQRDSMNEGIRAFEQANANLVDRMGQSLSDVREAFTQLPALAAEVRGGSEGFGRATEKFADRLESFMAGTKALDERAVVEIAGLIDAARDASRRIEASASKVMTAVRALEETTHPGPDVTIGAAVERPSGPTESADPSPGDASPGDSGPTPDTASQPTAGPEPIGDPGRETEPEPGPPARHPVGPTPEHPDEEIRPSPVGTPGPGDAPVDTPAEAEARSGKDPGITPDPAGGRAEGEPFGGGTGSAFPEPDTAPRKPPDSKDDRKVKDPGSEGGRLRRLLRRLQRRR